MPSTCCRPQTSVMPWLPSPGGYAHATLYVDPSGLSALVACRLIALDKCPGVRPIGIGETARCIIGDDIQAAAAPIQVGAGHISGVEAAVHAIRSV